MAGFEKNYLLMSLPCWRKKIVTLLCHVPHFSSFLIDFAANNLAHTVPVIFHLVSLSGTKQEL
jgi:hypothetical protein